MATMGFIKTDQEIKSEQNDSIIVPKTFTHSIAFGETGAGKTSSYIYPNLLSRMQADHGILFYDYKGKEHLSVKYLANKAKRLDDVVEIGKPWGAFINILQNMDDAALDKFFNLVLEHGKDAQFWQNSAKSLGQTILAVLKGIEDVTMALKAVDGIERREIEVETISCKCIYPCERTLKSLVEVCRTFESLKAFVCSLDELESNIAKQIKKAALYVYAEQGNSNELQEKLLKLISAKERLESIIKKHQSSLDSFGEESNENLTQNIMGSLIGPLLTLAQNDSFNTNNFDIASGLNEGNIVIINVESLSNAVVEALSNSILYELSKRTKSVHINPISIFIDEVQRVVSAKSDLPIDVLREAKVDMFLATQNSALLKDKLKEEKFDALMGNLTQKFYFRSSSDEELYLEEDLRFLELFKYVCSGNNYSEVLQAEPIFLDTIQTIKVEFMYQKRLNVLEDYLYKYRKAAVIVMYDERFYKENKLLVLDIKTQKEFVREALSKKKIEYLHQELKKLLTFSASTQKKKLKEDLYDDYDPVEELWAV